ncbi:MAG TPA: efflux RND transporter permease subunit, partial [Spirochaetales bacterium]|nr:efflux RND transporter permease subunit [Spirochaetales bacterium]
MKASDFSIRHPAIVGILLASLLVFALLSYSSLNREMIPSVGLPAANVITAYPGAGAEEIERTVTREIEDQLSTLAGVSSMKSTSKDSYSVVSVDFRDGVDVYEKLPQIRELLNGVRDRLPEGLRGEPEIIVSEASGILPIFSVRVDSDIDRVVLAKRVEEDLVPRLTRIKGVSKVNVRGGAKRRVRVDLDLDRLEARGISPLQAYEALRYANRNLPAGSADWRGSRLSLTTMGALASLEEAEGVAVGQKDGSAIYLGDVAQVAFELEPPEYRILSGGRDVLVVDILKREDGNTIDIVRDARRELDAFSARQGGAAGWKVLTDQAETTEASLAVVVQSAFMGTLLAVLVILLFLHDWRATLIIGASIPL